MRCIILYDIDTINDNNDIYDIDNIDYINGWFAAGGKFSRVGKVLNRERSPHGTQKYESQVHQAGLNNNLL